MSSKIATKSSGFTLALCLLGVSAIAGAVSTGCVKKVESKQSAFEISRGQTMNRVYAAYDPENPMQISWYLCKNESQDRNAPVTVSQVGPLPLGVRIAQALNNLAPLDPVGKSNSDPSASTIERVSVQRNIRLIERMTVREFQDPESGKGCAPIVPNGDAVSMKDAKEKVGRYFEKKVDIESTALMIGALFACVGVSKEAFVTGSSFIQGMQGVPDDKFKPVLGMFKTSKIDLKNNAGGLIWNFVTGLGYCALSSRGLFSKVSERFSLTDPNRAALFKFMDTVSVKAEDLLMVSKWDSTLSTDAYERLSYLKTEVAAEEARLELAKSQLEIASANSAIALQATKDYASVYNPLFVATWNAVETVTVTEDSSVQGAFMTRVVNGINGMLTGISKSLTGVK